MFRTIDYSHNRALGSVKISVQYQTFKDSIEHTESLYFSNKASADSWFIGLRKNYLTQKVERYLHHKKNIIENGFQHRGNDAKKIALAACFSFLKWATDIERVQRSGVENGLNDIETVCHFLLKIETEMRAVLPGPKNPSYQSSRDEISDIICFAKNQLEFENQLKRAC